MTRRLRVQPSQRLQTVIFTLRVEAGGAVKAIAFVLGKGVDYEAKMPRDGRGCLLFERRHPLIWNFSVVFYPGSALAIRP